MKITERHITMVHPKGFDRLFEREIPNHPTYEAAFNSLNEEYFEAFGEYRYKNYEAYRKTREQRIKFKKTEME